MARVSSGKCGRTKGQVSGGGCGNWVAAAQVWIKVLLQDVLQKRVKCIANPHGHQGTRESGDVTLETDAHADLGREGNPDRCAWSEEIPQGAGRNEQLLGVGDGGGLSASRVLA